MITLQDLILKTNAISLHEMGITGRGIKVALLDSGIDSNHEIFKGKNIKSFQLHMKMFIYLTGLDMRKSCLKKENMVKKRLISIQSFL